MRAGRRAAQFISAVLRRTPAFAPASSRSGGFLAQLWSAVARNSPAFGGQLNIERPRLRSQLDVQITRPNVGTRPPDDDAGDGGSSPAQLQRASIDATTLDGGVNEMRREALRAAIDVASSDSWIRGGRELSYRAPDDLSSLDSVPPALVPSPGLNPPVTLRRVSATLDLLDIRHLTDSRSSLLALWERHALLFAIEGPDDEILVIRTRPHATVIPELSTLAYRAVNEWNHSRRFMKAYVGDPVERGQLPIYAEWQVPLGAGIHDALLLEIVDTAASVSTTFVDWLHGNGGILL